MYNRYQPTLPSNPTDSQSVANRVARFFSPVLYEQPSPVTEHIYLGNKEDARDFAKLAKLGITDVVNCASSEVPCYHEKVPHFRYFKIDVVDSEDGDHASELRKAFAGAMRFIEKSRKDHDLRKGRGKNGCRRVLVHCRAGVSRSTTIVLAYLMKLDGPSSRERGKKMQLRVATHTQLRPELICLEVASCFFFCTGMRLRDALAWTKRCRPIVCPNPAFRFVLAKYELDVFKGQTSVGDQLSLRKREWDFWKWKQEAPKPPPAPPPTLEGAGACVVQ